MRGRSILLLAVTISVVVVAWTLLSPTGLHGVVQLREEKRVLTEQIAKAQDRNDRIADEIRLLQSPEGKALWEKKAREELGYVGKDEIVLLLQPSAPSQREGFARDLLLEKREQK